MAKRPCEWGWTNSPACNETYAASLGSVFTAIQALYCTAAAILVAFAGLCIWRIVVTKGWKLGRWDTQQVIVASTAVAAFTFLLRSIDPFGWRTILPLAFYVLLDDTATCCLLLSLYVPTFVLDNVFDLNAYGWCV